MASDRTPKSGLTLRQLALASALGCALAAAAYTVGTNENPIGPVTVSPPGIATDSTQVTVRSGNAHFAVDRNWADELHRAPIEIDSGAPIFGSKSSTPPPPPVAKTAPTVPLFSLQQNAAFSSILPPAQSGGAIGPGAVPMGQTATASVSPFGVLAAPDQSTAATSGGTTGGTVTSRPTIGQMPIMPPMISQMPILPPRSGNMPMFPPAPGATMAITPASSRLSTTPAPKK